MVFSKTVHEKYDMLTKSHKKVADYFIDNLDNVAFCTLEEVAGRIGVSTTTVIRFSRFLGYSGFTEMLKDIQSRLQTKVSLPERLSSAQSDTLLVDSFEIDISNIKTTLASQDPVQIAEAIKLISEAPRVFVLGMRSSFSLSYYMTSRLSEIRPNVQLIQSSGMLYPEEIVSAKPGDVCIAYVFPRYSKLSTTIIDWFKKEGVKVVLITSIKHSPLLGYSDYILTCSIKSASYKNSYAGPMALSNYLVAAIAQKNISESQRMLARTEEILKESFYLDE